MKLSNLTAKLTCRKSGVMKVLAAVMLAGAALTAAAPAAQAQQFAVGVHVGGPYRYGPAPRVFVERPRVVYGPAFYGPRFDGWRGHEDFRFHHPYARHF